MQRTKRLLMRENMKELYQHNDKENWMRRGLIIESPTDSLNGMSWQKVAQILVALEN